MDKKTVTVLQRCYIKPFTIQSNYAREHAHSVAELASRGLITTAVGTATHTNAWRVTSAGCALLEYSGEKLK